MSRPSLDDDGSRSDIIDAVLFVKVPTEVGFIFQTSGRDNEFVTH